jgi:AraC-like DNA-binding protein
MFIETEGIGIKQYILDQRLEAAKNLLLYSDADIGTIATYVGFCDQSHFGKMFKKATGMTPRQYRVTQQK